jgi:sugar lactone lactonase YvrE
MLPETWPRLGQDSALFVWDESWSAAPDRLELGNTHGGMAVDRAGLIYASRDTAPAMLIYNQRGQQVGAWGDDLGGGLHGMCLVEEQGEEYLYLAHTARHQVLKTTLSGTVLWTLDLPEGSGIYAAASEYHPTSIAVATDGRIFVADGYGKGYVHRYSAAREYLGSFGGPGNGEGEFHTPHGLIVDERGAHARVLVADRENNRVQAFDLEGKFESVLPVEFRRPCGVAIGHDGRLAVPELAGRVSLLNAQDQLLTRLGDNPDSSQWAQNGLPREQWQAGIFISPHGAAFDQRGNLYVQDWLAAGRFTRLVRQ